MILFSEGNAVIGVTIVVGYGLGQAITGGLVDGAPDHLANWGASLGLGIAAAILYVISLIQRKRVIVDRETGEREPLRPPYTLFFIPLGFWIPICFALSAWWLVLGFIQRSDTEKPADQSALAPGVTISNPIQS